MPERTLLRIPTRVAKMAEAKDDPRCRHGIPTHQDCFRCDEDRTQQQTGGEQGAAT